MKGYIYTMFRGADPGQGWHMTDPIFGKIPTLGACVPNIRRVVTSEDYIFVIKGQRVCDIIGRWRRLNKVQIEQMLEWIQDVKHNPGQAL
jgi:hypothetical protein